MSVHDLKVLAAGLPLLAIDEATEHHEAMAAHHMIAPVGAAWLGMVRFTGASPWEWHPQDELLQVLDGQMTAELATAGGIIRYEVGAGQVLVAPATVWHRLIPDPAVTLLFLTSGEGNRHADGEQPPAE